MSEWDKTDHPEILSEQTILISMSCREAGMLIAAASGADHALPRAQLQPLHIKRVGVLVG